MVRSMDNLVTLLDEIGKCAVRHGRDVGAAGNVFLWLGASAYESPPFVVFVDPLCELDSDVELVASL